MTAILAKASESVERLTKTESFQGSKKSIKRRPWSLVEAVFLIITNTNTLILRQAITGQPLTITSSNQTNHIRSCKST
jgi:hypothetical protein